MNYIGETRLTIAELARLTGRPYMTVRNHMRAGKCPFPQRKMTGGSKDPAYSCWENMVQRCTNPKARNYRSYGGRGISLSPEFLSFYAFIKHIGPRPGKGYSIDRVDNTKGYVPGNIRWATYKEQAANKRCHRRHGPGIERHGNKFRFKYKGKLLCFATLEEASEAKTLIYGEGSW